jgi:hypothetical protein
MFPGVNAQQWCVLAHDWVLVGICSDLDMSSFIILNKPSPATALNTCECGVKLCFEIGEIAVTRFDGGL